MPSISSAQSKIIGKGIAYPRPFLDSKGGTKVTEEYERINQSISVILSTPKGTRIGNRSFGSMLHTLVFELNDLILADLITLYCKDSLTLWEPRIDVLDVVAVVDPDNENELGVNIYYALKNSNIENNYVYVWRRRDDY